MKNYLILLGLLGITSSLSAYTGPEEIKKIQSGDQFSFRSDIIFNRHENKILLNSSSADFSSSKGTLNVKFECEVKRNEESNNLSCGGYPLSKISKSKYHEINFSLVNNTVSRKSEPICKKRNYYDCNMYSIDNLEINIKSIAQKNNCSYQLYFKCSNTLYDVIEKLALTNNEKSELFLELAPKVSDYQLQGVANLINVKLNTDPATEWP